MVKSRERRRQLAREKWERQQRRRAERSRRMRRRSIVIGAVLATLAVIGAGIWIGWTVWPGDDDSASASAGTDPNSGADDSSGADEEPARAPQPAGPGECLYVKEVGSDRVPVGLPPEKVDPAAAPTEFVLTTDRGKIKGELFADTAECAVNSFAYLATEDVFADSTCTELSAKPAEQRYLGCGDLTGSGAGDPAYIYATEPDPDRTEYEAGLLVLAEGDDRGSGRFHITYGDPQELTGAGTVFGKVNDGLDIVEEVAKAGVEDGSPVVGVGRPNETLVIEDVAINEITE